MVNPNLYIVGTLASEPQHLFCCYCFLQYCEAYWGLEKREIDHDSELLSNLRIRWPWVHDPNLVLRVRALMDTVTMSVSVLVILVCLNMDLTGSKSSLEVNNGKLYHRISEGVITDNKWCPLYWIKILVPNIAPLIYPLVPCIYYYYICIKPFCWNIL